MDNVDRLPPITSLALSGAPAAPMFAPPTQYSLHPNSVPNGYHSVSPQTLPTLQTFSLATEPARQLPYPEQPAYQYGLAPLHAGAGLGPGLRGPSFSLGSQYANPGPPHGLSRLAAPTSAPSYPQKYSHHLSQPLSQPLGQPFVQTPFSAPGSRSGSADRAALSVVTSLPHAHNRSPLSARSVLSPVTGHTSAASTPGKNKDSVHLKKRSSESHEHLNLLSKHPALESHSESHSASENHSELSASESHDEHLDSRPEKKRKKRKCSECNGYFSNLATHKSTHLQPTARPHMCDICHRGFARPNDLFRHHKCHWREMGSSGQFTCPFKSTSHGALCTHSSGVFSRCDTYKNHLKAIHFQYPAGTKKSDRPTAPGQCKLCNASFDNVDVWLSSHVESRQCPRLG